MAAKRDCYEILGIDKKADAAAIKKAYRKLAKKYHPDTNKNNPAAAERFKEINEAYDILGNEEKRRLYDEYGYMAFEPGFSEETAKMHREAGNWQRAKQGNPFGYGGPEDIWEDMFGEYFRTKTGGAYGGSRMKKGRDIQAEITIRFDEAVLGCDKTFSLQNADGTVQSIQVHIPAGVDTGSKVRLKGKGGSGRPGGENGDLYLNITVEEKDGYERKGQDLYTTVNIPFTTAVLGGEIRVHTYYGDVMCRVREGTQSGSRIRLKGKGVVSMKNPAVYGDLYITIQIQVPRHLTSEAKRELLNFQKASGY